MNGCIYRTEHDVCKKYTTDQATSFCVGRNCLDRKPSNSDHIRAMTDEELAVWIAETSNCSDWCILNERCKSKPNNEA